VRTSYSKERVFSHPSSIPIMESSASPLGKDLFSWKHRIRLVFQSWNQVLALSVKTYFFNHGSKGT